MRFPTNIVNYSFLSGNIGWKYLLNTYYVSSILDQHTVFNSEYSTLYYKIWLSQ